MLLLQSLDFILSLDEAYWRFNGLYDDMNTKLKSVRVLFGPLSRASNLYRTFSRTHQTKLCLRYWGIYFSSIAKLQLRQLWVWHLASILSFVSSKDETWEFFTRHFFLVSEPNIFIWRQPSFHDSRHLSLIRSRIHWKLEKVWPKRSRDFKLMQSFSLRSTPSYQEFNSPYNRAHSDEELSWW